MLNIHQAVYISFFSPSSYTLVFSFIILKKDRESVCVCVCVYVFNSILFVFVKMINCSIRNEDPQYISLKNMSMCCASYVKQQKDCFILFSKEMISNNRETIYLKKCHRKCKSFVFF